MIGIIDYGAGNIGNVVRAVKYLGLEYCLLSKPDTTKLKLLILPGVGAFKPAIDNLKATGWYEKIIDWYNKGNPIIGICLGMQLLCEKSNEGGTISHGFGFIKGDITKFVRPKKIPHIGWNKVHWVIPPVYDFDIESCFYYFVHSYRLTSLENAIGITEYDGEVFVSAVKKDNLIAFQFHPERSGKSGLLLLKKIIEKA